MALPSFLKHIRALERSGCIRTVKSGRVRMCSLEPGAFGLVEAWLAGERAVWEGRTDRLSAFVTETTSSDTTPADGMEGKRR